MRYIAKYDRKKIHANIDAVAVWEVCDKKFPDGVEVEVSEKDLAKLRELAHFSIREVADPVAASKPEVKASK